LDPPKICIARFNSTLMGCQMAIYECVGLFANANEHANAPLVPQNVPNARGHITDVNERDVLQLVGSDENHNLEATH